MSKKNISNLNPERRCVCACVVCVLWNSSSSPTRKKSASHKRVRYEQTCFEHPHTGKADSPSMTRWPLNSTEMIHIYLYHGKSHSSALWAIQKQVPSAVKSGEITPVQELHGKLEENLESSYPILPQSFVALGYTLLQHGNFHYPFEKSVPLSLNTSLATGFPSSCHSTAVPVLVHAAGWDTIKKGIEPSFDSQRALFQ